MGKKLPANKDVKELKEEFKFPANIKQIGNVDRDIKMYIEDYVYTYLYQFGKGSGGEKLAVLVGKHFEVDNTKVIMVSGAIEGVATEYNDDDLCFTEKSWNYIVSQKEKYFKGLTILGWVHIQPDFGTNLMARDLAFHRKCFGEMWQILFVMDPMEKTDTFYCYEKDNLYLKQSRGYFIYYEKNELMQTYIMENSSIKPKEAQEEEAIAGAESGKTALQRLLGMTAHVKTAERSNKKAPIDRIDAAGRIRGVLKQKAEEKQREAKVRFIALSSISGALCIACFIICLSLFTNQGRIQRLEEELISVKTSYDAINEMVASTTEQVFATQKTVNENIQAMKEQPPLVKEEIKKEVVALPKEGSYDIYSVEEGDSLWYISILFYGEGDDVYSIMEANGLTNADKIFSGQKLIIPKK